MSAGHEAPSLESLLYQQRYVQAAPYLSGIIHDMNNSLGAIIAYADLLSMGSNSPEEIDSMLENIVESARNMEKIGDALAMIARDDSREPVDTNIPKLIEKVVTFCEFRMQSKDVKWDVSMDGDLTKTYVCKPEEIGRAIMYMLRNAMENVENAETKWVELHVDLRPDALRIRVRDSGPPMDDDQFRSALEAYSGSKNGQEHLRLGLTAVSRIAEMHNGQLSYSPEAGFSLAIPAAEPDA